MVRKSIDVVLSGVQFQLSARLQRSLRFLRLSRAVQIDRRSRKSGVPYKTTIMNGER
jgi:hypothetical protein